MEYLIFVFLVTHDVKEHFLDEDMYVTAKGIKRVLKTAVPRVAIEPDNGDDTEVGPTMPGLGPGEGREKPLDAGAQDRLLRLTLGEACLQLRMS
ncbi:unnamed protein product [Arctia plantaginis]|uniref:Uncharacterized protein n=1 Tax=Arctia plantaginis TaxID=874455 RepID=A0A8S1ACQ7_ARCPL|nr:unnamed protein product [Arctia plantaginis]